MPKSSDKELYSMNKTGNANMFDYGQQAKKDLMPLFSILECSVGPFPTHKKKKGYEWLRVTGSAERWIKIPGSSDQDKPGSQPIGLRMSRALSFEKADSDFLESYAKSISELARAGEFDFFEEAKETLVSRAIAGQLSNELDENNAFQIRSLVISILNYLQQATSMTYEGKRLALNIVFDADEKNFEGNGAAPYTLAEYKDLPWAPALGATHDTAISVCIHDGEVKVHSLQDLTSSLNASGERGTDTGSEEVPAPERMAMMAAWTSQGSRVGFSLFESGDIAIVVGGIVRYVYRQGSWRTFQLTHVLSKAWGGMKLPRNIKTSVIETVLDASFHRHGGGLAIVSSGQRGRYNAEIRDQVFRPVEGGAELPQNSSSHSKPYWQYAGGESIASNLANSNTLSTLADKRKSLFENGRISLYFQHLSRSQRLELLNMDGATILDHEGRILGIGVIFPLKSADQTGGRESAARTLAQFGCAFKVSQDGPVSLYGYEKITHVSSSGETEHGSRLITKIG